MEPYVDKLNGGYRIRGTRVSLDSVVHGFLRGLPPEAVAQAFPVLTLEQVYGALTFYLAHRDEVDRHLEAADAEFEALRRESRDRDSAFAARLADARRRGAVQA